MSKALKDYNSIDWSELFYYDVSSPTFLRWKTDRYTGKKKSVIRVKSGSKAGNIFWNEEKKTKYCTVSAEHTNWFAHRVIWILHFGYLPEELVIDHIDGNSLNNNIENLRAVKQEINNRNASIRKDNTTGESGVYFTTAKSSGKRQTLFTYATASWYETSGKRKCKHFSVYKFGLIPAFKMAIECRNKMIENLNILDAGYTENHGTKIDKGV